MARRTRVRAAFGALALTGALLLAVDLAPAGSGAFTSGTSSGGSWSTGTLSAPTGLGASRPCPSSGPTLKGFTSATSSSTSVTVTTPSAAAGDVLVAFVAASSAAGSASSGGWNTLGQVTASGSVLTGLYLPLSGAPAASYTFTWSAGQASVLLASYTGVDPYSPVATMTTTSNGSGSTTATSSTITAPRVPGRVALALLANNAPVVVDPGGQTRRSSVASPDGVAGLTVWDGAISASGTTPAYASTWTGSQPWAMLPVYLQSPTTPAKDPTVTLTWTASGAPATGYSITRSGGSFAVGGAATTTYTDTATSGSTAYTYTVRSTAGGWSSAGTATVNVSACP